MLEFSHVSASCGHTPILDDISVSFANGMITSIVGPNGCGKTTLVQCLNGSSKVTAGSIRIDGDDFLKLSSRERATRLAFLPQVRTIIPALPVKTLVEHGRFPHLGFSRRKSQEDIAIVQKAMKTAHVIDYADWYVDTLSGGIRQRVFFAMLLAQDCDYLVFDEPTTYLDLKGQQEFYALARTLKAQGKTVILILHDLDQAIRISDSLIVMNERKIAAQAAPKDCLKQHVIEDVFQASWKRFSDADGEYYFFY